MTPEKNLKPVGGAIPMAGGDTTNKPDLRGRSLGGVVDVVSNSTLLAREAAAAETAARARQNTPIIQGLAQHVRNCFEEARKAKEQEVEPRMFESLRQRRGEYSPDDLAVIKAQGGTQLYMRLTGHKCRTASAWIRDVLAGTGNDKPWSLDPTPIPDLPTDVYNAIVQVSAERLAELEQAGVVPTQAELMELMSAMRDQVMRSLYEEAQDRAKMMERKIEDQLTEGGWDKALSQFIDDIVVYPSAIIKAPVVRRRPQLRWVKNDNGQSEPVVEDVLTLEAERVDPLNFYHAPFAVTVDDGYTIERHKLTRTSLSSLIGVQGYDSAAIKQVLLEYGKGGLENWLSVDSQKAELNGESIVSSSTGSKPIEALQFFGYVQGQMLIDFGMDRASVPDPEKDYACEVWVIGQWVIKATLNADPLGRKPYHKASYEEVPGSFWGNSVCDMIRDVQTVCNSTARALVNNMAIGSGPQVVYDVSKLPVNEDVTQMYPWKIWKVESDPFATNSGKPIDFFQPTTMSSELMMVYEKFAQLADEYSGLPRVMSGESPTGGVGRTASAVSMVMNNANKSIKQVMANIDTHMLKPLLNMYYFYNMRFGDDEEIKGDVNIVARGSLAVAVKDSAQVRRNEFLMTTLNSPVVSQIVGEEGIAALLRETAKTLDMNADKIVPSQELLRARKAMDMIKQQQLLAAQQAQQPQVGGPSPSGQELAGGVPVTDNFSPPAQ